MKIKQCRICGTTDLSKFFQSSLNSRKTIFACKQCNGKETAERYRKNKRAALAYKGDKCSMCGYDKCVAALDFHHLDPATKDPNWHTLRGRSLKQIKQELDKCILVCNRCHKEIHHLTEEDETENELLSSNLSGCTK